MPHNERVTTSTGTTPRSAHENPTSLSTGRVVLFSGHMIDAPGRITPRFPPDMVPEVTNAIQGVLAAWNIGHHDLGMCGGACGGDLIFAEACLHRGARVELHLPYAVPTFIEQSVAFAGHEWVNRFHAVAENRRTTVHVMPDEPEEPPDDESRYTRHARWLLDRAFARGTKNICVLCLWDGAAGDGPGGTADMLAAVEARRGKTVIIDSARLLAERRTP